MRRYDSNLENAVLARARAWVAMPPGQKWQHAIIGIGASRMIQRLADGFFQGRQLEWLAQDPGWRCGGLHHIAVAAGEENRNLRITVLDLLCQGNPVHAARHDDIAENERDL